MQRIIREWIKKAEGDWLAALLLHRARKHPNHDLVCFLSQQCAEKYFKARLKEAGVAFTKTHDLQVLLGLAVQVEPSWTALRRQAKALNAFAVDIRYPGRSATKARAKKAIEDCREIRRAVRTAFGLPV
jgi:HEPN domain-containing protein